SFRVYGGVHTRFTHFDESLAVIAYADKQCVRTAPTRSSGNSDWPRLRLHPRAIVCMWLPASEPAFTYVLIFMLVQLLSSVDLTRRRHNLGPEAGRRSPPQA